MGHGPDQETGSGSLVRARSSSLAWSLLVAHSDLESGYKIDPGTLNSGPDMQYCSDPNPLTQFKKCRKEKIGEIIKKALNFN